MEIYVDGACIPNPGTGGWAIVRIKEEEIVFKKNGVLIDSTNNIAELMAIKKAIEHFNEEGFQEELIIYSDSQYAINSALGLYKTKKNVELISSIRELVLDLKRRGIELSLEWVRGHAGNVGNEIADYYANIILE